MRGEQYFELPDDPKQVAELIEAVPDSWGWCDGFLAAPEVFVRNGLAEEHTGIALQRFHDIKPTIVGNYDSKAKKQRKPDLYALLVEQKLPGFILFDEAGYGSQLLRMEVVKRIASAFVRKGYAGSLYFYSRDHRNFKYENPARCAIRNDERPRIHLQWEGKYGGTEADMTPILELCQLLNLRGLTLTTEK